MVFLKDATRKRDDAKAKGQSCEGKGAIQLSLLCSALATSLFPHLRTLMYVEVFNIEK